jgi:hypothetical protein
MIAGKGDGFKWQLFENFIIIRETKDESTNKASELWPKIMELPLSFDPRDSKKRGELRIFVSSIRMKKWFELELEGWRSEGFTFCARNTLIDMFKLGHYLFD